MTLRRITQMTLCLLFVFLIQSQVVKAEKNGPRTIADLAEQKEWEEIVKRLANDGNPNEPQADGMTALHWCAFYDNAKVARLLLNSKASIDSQNAYHVTPLSLACEYGNADIGQVLIKNKANLESIRLGKETPLMLAARNGNSKLVQLLINSGAKIDEKESKGQTALMWAAAAGNLEAVDALIKAKADIEYRLSKSDFTAMMFAARQGRTDVVLRFLDAGMDVNSVIKPKRAGGRNPRKEMSAMMLAIESGHLELAFKLVERGANPNDARSGFSPLHAITWVRKTGRGDNPEGDPAPRITGGITSLEFANRLIKAGADVNLKLKWGYAGKAKLNPKGATPFLFASKTADIPLLKLLLELGADPTLTNVDGTTALMAAAGIGVVSVGEEPGTEEEVIAAIKMMIQIGIDPNVVDKNGETAMHGAAYRNFPEVVKLLARVGADPKVWNQKNKHGWTPFSIAKGKRPGSVKPSPETIAALNSALNSK